MWNTAVLILHKFSQPHFNGFIMLLRLSYQHLFKVKMFAGNFPFLQLMQLVAFFLCYFRNMMTATEQLMMTKDMSRMTTTTVIKDKSKFSLFLHEEFTSSVFLGFTLIMDNLCPVSRFSANAGSSVAFVPAHPVFMQKKKKKTV